MGDLLTQVIGVLGSIMAVSLSGYAVYRGNTKAKRIESEAAPYQQLADRVGDLERRVTDLQNDQWVDRTFIQRMVSAWSQDRPLPQPLPAWLSMHYGLPPMSQPTPGSVIERPPNHH